MDWLLIGMAVVLEVCGTLCMKLSQGFTRPLPSALIFVFYAGCFFFMTLAVKRMDISVVYAVWSGLGTALVTVAGICWFHEPATFLRLASILLIIAGVAGLHLSRGTGW